MCIDFADFLCGILWLCIIYLAFYAIGKGGDI